MKEGEVDLKSITEEAKIENIAVITDFVNSILEANGCSAKVQMEIDIAIDEIFGNIAYYAYTPKTGEATVHGVYFQHWTVCSPSRVRRGGCFWVQIFRQQAQRL